MIFLTINGMSITRFEAARRRLLSWHEVHGRHDLPWRGAMNPYKVLVSEFMLQQTTVTTVRPRFIEWMNLFPSLSDLAIASEEDVLSAWQGLGYYSRARRLHATAKSIVAKHSEVVPKEEKNLRVLPGIGDYTAAAIRAFAYDQHALVLDTNIVRVLARWANLTTPIDTANGKKSLVQIAESFYPKSGCREVATALMDLGSSLCRSREPACKTCPLQKSCQAVNPASLPRKTPRAVISKLSESRVWLYQRGRLFLKLSEGPRWRGLWILPELGEGKPVGRAMTEICYPITRYRVTMRIYRAAGLPDEILRGFTPQELESIPIPTPHRRAIAAIGFSVHNPEDVQDDA